MKLTQSEIDLLIAIEKELLNPNNVGIPLPSKNEVHKLKPNNLSLALYRGKRGPNKSTYKIIYEGSTVLLRLDLNPTTIHYNPTGEIIGRGVSHIHIYTEEYGDAIAYEANNILRNTEDIVNCLYDFMSYSNIINIDEVIIQGVLWDD